MTNYGVVLALFASFFYVIRNILVKELTPSGLSCFQINFIYRMVSLALLLLFLVFFPQTLSFKFDSSYLFLMIFAVVFSFIFGIFQVKVFQNQPFSQVNSFSFLNIMLTSIIGILIFNDVLIGQQLLGLLLINVAFLLLLFRESRLDSRGLILIFAYYLLGAIIAVFQTEASRQASPTLFVLFLTVSSVFTNGLASFKDKKSFSRSHQNQTWYLLILLGVVAFASFLSASYSYRFLPTGVCTAILSFSTFISFFVSRHRYNEPNLRSKVIASSIATLGVILLVV